MVEQDLRCTLALLERTPAALNALLRDLPSAWTLGNEGEKTWNAFEVVGHLAYAETSNWMPRVRALLAWGETRSFPPFDRSGHLAEIQGKSLAQVLDEFAARRSHSLDELRALELRPEDLGRQGRHPALGVVSLSQLLAAWAAHDLTHVHQISRILAVQYRAAVGPWSRFLGVLQCAGHSSA